jgi:DNA-directed RNA polymerase I subunit RPA1
MQLDSNAIMDKFSSVQFSFYQEDEIERLSVKEINNQVAFDHLGNPTPGGIYDQHLGISPFDKKSQCKTCGLDSTKCPGHCGHISLTAPCYNPFLIKQIYRLLKSMCVQCYKLRIQPYKLKCHTMALFLLKAGQLNTF